MEEGRKVVGTAKDLGMAAYLKMRGYKLLRRRGKEFDFTIKESEQERFEEEKVDYVNSAFATFDSELMHLKKL